MLDTIKMIFQLTKEIIINYLNSNWSLIGLACFTIWFVLSIGRHITNGDNT